MVGTKGFPVSTIWEDDTPVNVVLRVDKTRETSHEDIENQYVTSPFLISSVLCAPLRSLRKETPGNGS
jgi:hypothetical protein